MHGIEAMSTFNDRIEKRKTKIESILCVGLDPDPAKLPEGDRSPSEIFHFLNHVIEGTAQYAVAYKPNLAFFEALGIEGWKVFEKTIQAVRDLAPGAQIIADAKRGDIGNTAGFYARTFFETFDCDALTVNPFMGPDTIESYLDYRDRGVIALCFTSNPGAGTYLARGEDPLYIQVARDMEERNRQTGNIWLVVGATRDAESVKRIRSVAPDLPFLVPGVGTQGGDSRSILQAGGNRLLISASRSILYPPDGRIGDPDSHKKEAEKLTEEFRNILKEMGGSGKFPVSSLPETPGS